jgi:hypothetical protein
MPTLCETLTKGKHMPKIKSYNDSSNDTSNLLMSLFVVAVATVAVVALLGIYSL